MATAEDKIIAEARERYEYAREKWAPIYSRARDDLRFSDPTDPKQWPDEARRARETAEGGARPCLVFDQTGQYVRQVINQARRNKPAVKFLPVDDRSDPKLAEVLQGLARQTEYESRAEVAYIQALDHATRGGIGYFVLRTHVKDEETNSQCAKIERVVDFETVLPDPDFMELDGSDMRWGFIEEVIPRKDFKKRWPKAKEVQFESDGWADKDHIRVCEYFRRVETKDEDGGPARRRVEWFKISGEEILEESEFPSQWVPIFPVIGNEAWEDGKRNVSGAIRMARDAQVAYNYERNAEIEAVAIGPKAPWLAAAEAIEGYERQWRMANQGNQAYLPWNAVDEQGNPIPRPERINPAGIASGWTQLSERSRADIQSAFGMFEASTGNNPNSQSGRAVLALQDKSDLGSFHYVDNLALAISHCGSVLTEVWPRIYDTEQVLRIVGEDGESDFVRVDPTLPVGYQERETPTGETQVVINPAVGKFDVRVTVGPSFNTRQAEAAAEIGELVNGNPQMLALLGDVWVKMRNFPEADRVAKRLRAMLPPQVLKAEEDEQPQLPPVVAQTLQQAAQEIEQLRQALQEAQSGIAQEQAKAQASAQEQALKAQLERERDEADARLKLTIEQMKQEAEERRAERDAAMKKYIADLEASVRLQIAGQSSVDKDKDRQADVLAASLDGFREVVAQINRPKRLIRGPDGRAEGIE